MAITLTENAATEVKRIMTEGNLPEETVLRIRVVGGGCSGFQYGLGLDEHGAKVEEDVVEEHHGVKVAVDKKSDLFLDGTRLDFITGIERRGFHFDNPNAVKSCGCGSSFSA